MLHRFTLSLLVICLLGALWASPAPAGESGALLWVEFSLAGRLVRVSNGGMLSLHPDAAFRVSQVRLDGWLEGLLGRWLDSDVQVRLLKAPAADLGAFHTLGELLGDEVFNLKKLRLEVRRQGAVLGGVTLAPHLAPIDWLRRAQAAKDVKQKIACTRKALELSPDDRLLLLNLTDLLADARRYKEAVELIEQYAAQDDDPRLQKRLAGLYGRLGLNQRAAGALSKLLAESPQDQELLSSLAGLYEKLGRWEEASQMLRRLADLRPRPRRGAVLMRLAEALKRAGKTKEADQALEAALAANPGDAGLWRQAAEARKRAGQGAKALEALERAALLAPEDQELCERLAAEYLAGGREARAAAQYEELIALRPRDASLLVKLAGVYQGTGDKDALKRTYRRLARLKPNDPDLQYNLAVIALDQKDYQEALQRLDAAARARPDDPEINDARLDALLKLGKWDAAAKLAGRMADLSADSLKLLRRLYPSLSKRRPKLMAGLLERALRKKPKQAGLYEMAADLRLGRDDPAGAAEALRRGVAALPDNTRLMFNLAQVYEAQGRDKEALDVLARLLDRDPDYPGAGERYLQLKTRDLKNDRKTDKSGEPDN